MNAVNRWWTLAVLGLSLLVIGLDHTILNVALPTLQLELEASGSELQWMVDAYVLVFAGLLLPMGAIADRFGRKLALQSGLVAFGAASLLAVFAEQGWHLIAARAAMGVGGALIMPATLSIVTAVFPREERGKAIGIWAAIAGLGIGLGPLLGGALIEAFGWSWVFLVNVPALAIALLAGIRLVPESRDPLERRLDLGGAVLAAGAVSTVVYAVIEAPNRGWLDAVTLGLLGLSALLTAGFVAWERRVEHPMLDLDFFRRRQFSGGAAAISLAFFALFGLTFLLTQYLQLVLGHSALAAGYRVAPIALGLMVGAGTSHRLVGLLGARATVRSGLAILAGALVAIAFFGTATGDAAIIPTLVAVAFAMGLVMAPATDLVMGAVPEAKAGVGSATNDVTRMVGGALGVAVIGSVASSIYSSGVEDSLRSLPGPADAARDSIGAAAQVAARLGGEAGEALRDAASAAFLDGMGVALLVAAGVAAAAAVVVPRFLPGRLPAAHARVEHTTTPEGVVREAA